MSGEKHRYQVQTGTELFTVELQEDGAVLRAWLNGDEQEVRLRSMDSPHHFTLLAGGEMLEVYVEEIGDRYVIYLAGNVFEVAAAPQLVGRKDPTRSALPVNGSAAVNAPMPGLVLQVFVEPGQQVERGDVLLVLEAMKMENDIRAPAAGRVDHVGVRAGQRVDQGQRLVVID